MPATAQTPEHRLRCEPPLLALRTLARALDDEQGYVSRHVVVAVSQATSAVLAEVAAASQTTSGRSEQLLRTRLERLAGAAEAAIDAARLADRAELCRQLGRFEALTAAVWIVHEGLSDQAALTRPGKPETI